MKCDCPLPMRNFTGGIYCLSCNRQITREPWRFWYWLIFTVLAVGIAALLAR